MPSVKFKYPDEKSVYPKLISAVNALCIAMGKSCTCTSGYRSLEKQKIINAQKLAERKDNYQKPNGAVYNKQGQCIAAEYGKSNHCYCIAMDISDGWFKALTNKEIEKFGLVKPMSYEPWHVQLIEHTGLTLAQKIALKESVLGIKRS
ncbi:M15 family metallopeptidase [Ruminiclostridium cellulolyticum]|uniref:Peptidase M15B and M15C DD-carboxypeptidase VanY/endolysin n=1 Tax=Ruminiclostridium cellulolyticum (strain ATCC 35319 / DSM 5812 / JCM 6584 / H10) TaxID=394503 RepID=B8I0S6_RUMCH|nr:M15 family metallopeptidase [Ruminiclostridium cellulolyticum]ACL75651.1 peptidase M15B and M15C DD-carboxypeptidase VanY/endolysin [Ruminiclostridium cellulolyticum H10]